MSLNTETEIEYRITAMMNGARADTSDGWPLMDFIIPERMKALEALGAKPKLEKREVLKVYSDWEVTNDIPD